MPIRTYDGRTFIAFVDVSGFKKLMQDERLALEALDRFYQSGYSILGNQGKKSKVEGLLVSDCGILFVREKRETARAVIESLKSLLMIITQMNRRMITRNFMLTASIAYGRFRYQQRIEFPGIGKDPICGHAYVSAFLDNENGKPKIQPGQCRIIKRNLPDAVHSALKNKDKRDILRMIAERNGDREHLYFYWMLDDPRRIDRFEQRYTDAYNLKFKGMLEALKRDIC